MFPIPRDPINRDSARVIGAGVRVDNIPLPADYFQSETMPPIVRAKRTLSLLRSTDMTGTRSGKLTCLGLSSEKANRWIVRCDCGMFEMRSAKALKNQHAAMDACFQCKRLSQQKYMQKNPEKFRK